MALYGSVEFRNNQGFVETRCLDYFAKAPYSGQLFDSTGYFNGTVKLIYHKNKEKLLSLDEAIKSDFIEIYGLNPNVTYDRAKFEYKIMNRYDSMLIKLGRNGFGIKKLEFLEANIAISKYSVDKYRMEELIYYSKKFAGEENGQRSLWLLQSEDNEIKKYIDKGASDLANIKKVTQESRQRFDLLQKEYFKLEKLENKNRTKSIKKGFKEISSRPLKRGKSLVIIGNNLDISKAVESHILVLEDGGYCNIIKDSKNNLILIDGGKTERDADNIIDFIDSNYPKCDKRLMVINTHSDLDHLGGIKHMIKKGIIFKQILLPDVTNIERGKKQIEKFKTDIAIPFKYNEEIIADHFLLYTHNSNGSDFQSINLKKFNFSDAKYFSGFLQIPGSPLKINLGNQINAKNVNDRSLILRIAQGNRQLIVMGDAGISAIRKDHNAISKRAEVKIPFEEISENYNNLKDFSRFEIEDYVERVDALKIKLDNYKTTVNVIDDYKMENYLVWPHHYWLPPNNKPEELYSLIEWLKEINPKVIYISDPPNHVLGKQSLERLNEFLNKIKFDGNFEFEMKSLNQLKVDKEFKSILQKWSCLNFDCYFKYGLI
jgi:beta-lactamase superfamily II metal-dependent hydrolase